MQAVGVRGDLRTKGPEIRALRLGGTNQPPKILQTTEPPETRP
jgi:hypothetical protein